MKVIRTFNKAQEIFKNKLSQPFKQKNVDLLLENKTNSTKLIYKRDLTAKLYKLYKYNKFFTSRLKSLSKGFIFLSKKNIKYFILNKIIFIFKLILKIEHLSKRKLTYVYILKNKISFLQKRIFELSSKNLQFNKIKKEFKALLVQLKKIFFLIFFEYQVFIKKKLKKDFDSIKRDLNLLFLKIKKTENIQKLNYKLKSFSLELKRLIERRIINFNYSNIPIEKYLKRTWLIIKIYYLPFIVLIKNLSKAGINSTILNYLPSLNTLIPNLLETDQLQLEGGLVILYYGLFCMPKNFLSFPKETIQNGVFAAMYLLITMAASYCIYSIQTLLKSTVLLIKIYFQLFVIGKLRGVFINPEIGENLTSNYGFGVGGYQKYIEKLVSDSDKFINSSVLSPIFIILIITLLYNCCYYIIYNKQPYIPILTDLAKRQTPNTQRD